jgi:DNA-binding transcriptional MerR regulator
MGIKISEIAKRSGVAASTIRYYVKEGLLPEPERKNRNMSYYNEDCIEKIKAIRIFQEKKYYPLTIIKNIIRRMEEGLSIEEAEAIEQAVFGTETPVILDKKDYLLRTGLTEADLISAEAAQLLMPFIQDGKNKSYDSDDVKFGKILKTMQEYGIGIKGLSFYVEIGKELMEKEMAFRRQTVKGMSKKENIQLTSEISKAAETIRSYVLKRLFQRAVEKTILKSFLR